MKFIYKKTWRKLFKTLCDHFRFVRSIVILYSIDILLRIAASFLRSCIRVTLQLKCTTLLVCGIFEPSSKGQHLKIFPIGFIQPSDDFQTTNHFITTTYTTSEQRLITITKAHWNILNFKCKFTVNIRGTMKFIWKKQLTTQEFNSTRS